KYAHTPDDRNLLLCKERALLPRPLGTHGRIRAESTTSPCSLQIGWLRATCQRRENSDADPLQRRKSRRRAPAPVFLGDDITGNATREEHFAWKTTDCPARTVAGCPALPSRFRYNSPEKSRAHRQILWAQEAALRKVGLR